MRTLVFFLEEMSAKVMLEGLLPKFLPDNVVVRFIVFEGKQDLEKQLEKRLRGWRIPNSLFIVLRDQDSGACQAIKARLKEICVAAGQANALVRIACRELESWYLGDLPAVERALSIRGIAKWSASSKYRDPDIVGSPARELEKLTHGAYQKISGSRALGFQLSLTANKSHSFQVFLEGINRLLSS